MISSWTDLLSFLGGNSGQTAATGAGAAGAGVPAKQTTLPVAQNTTPVVAAGTPTKVPSATDEGIFGKALGSIKEHPELTAIILDYLGTSLAGRKEGNIASGLGTLLGKSSLNEKALKAIENKKTTEQENLIKTITDLNGKVVGSARGTTNLQAVREKVAAGVFKPKDIVVTETHPQGMLALKTGKIDAYSTDRSLLEGLRMKDKNPEKWMTVDFAIAYEPYAYIVRENDSDFRDFVNNTILWAIKTGEFFKLYEKWMGPKGPVPIKMSKAYKNYLNMIVYPIKEGWWKKK